MPSPRKEKRRDSPPFLVSPHRPVRLGEGHPRSFFFVERTAHGAVLFQAGGIEHSDLARTEGRHVERLAVGRIEIHCRIVRGLPEFEDDPVSLDSARNPPPAWLGAPILAPGINRRHTFET